jgi:hypothetical protein
MASANVCKGRVGRGHTSPTGTSSTPMGTNTGRTSLDTVSPAVGGSTMGDGQAGDLELNAVDGGGGRHRVRFELKIIIGAGGTPEGERCPVSELDRFGGGGADHLVMCGGVFNALGFQVGGDGVQDRQQLGTVSGTVQESGSEVAGHRSVGCVFFGIVADGGQPLRGLPASHPGQRCRWWGPSSGHRQGSSDRTPIPGGESGDHRSRSDGRRCTERNHSATTGQAFQVS